mmetsp:Transcript_13213/g.36438  ORF Transcript_13213/g.36438 Transcript_13213/m.36438 type:complete len:204 (-) Transcript_13213:452-1063(-)
MPAATLCRWSRCPASCPKSRALCQNFSPQRVSEASSMSVSAPQCSTLCDVGLTYIARLRRCRACPEEHCQSSDPTGSSLAHPHWPAHSALTVRTASQTLRPCRCTSQLIRCLHVSITSAPPVLVMQDLSHGPAIEHSLHSWYFLAMSSLARAVLSFSQSALVPMALLLAAISAPQVLPPAGTAHSSPEGRQRSAGPYRRHQWG